MCIESFLLVSIQRFPGKRFLRTSEGRRTTLTLRRLRVRRSSSTPCQIPSCGLGSSVGSCRNALKDCVLVVEEMPRNTLYPTSGSTSTAASQDMSVPIRQFACSNTHGLSARCISFRTDTLYFNYEVMFHFARQEDRDHWSSQWFVSLFFFHTKHQTQ